MIAHHGGFFQVVDFGVGVGVGHGALRGWWERLTIQWGNYGGLRKGKVCGGGGNNAKLRLWAKSVSAQPAGSEAERGIRIPRHNPHIS